MHTHSTGPETWEIRGVRGHWTILCDGRIVEDMFHVTKRDATERMASLRQERDSHRQDEDVRAFLAGDR